MGQFNMSNNLKKRIYTSISLLLLLFLMVINNYILGFFILIVGILSILEFFKMIKIVQKTNKVKQFIFNFLFIIYVFLICSAFLVFSSIYNIKILLFIILLTCIVSDIGGFVFGKLFKGPKLTKLSPNKTVSGSIGSLMFSAITFTTLIYNFNGSLNFNLILIGFVISITCQIGDLFFSFIKRKSNLKDTSNFLPGHGGVLDRIDGILFGLPVGFITLIIFY